MLFILQTNSYYMKQPIKIEITKYSKLFLYSTCMPCKGINRSIIFDLELNEYHFIPNILYEIIMKFEQKSILEVMSFYNNEYDEYIQSYIEFIVNKRLGFISNSKVFENILKLEEEWDYPAVISNSIIMIDDKSNYDLPNVLNQIIDLGCRDYIICFQKPISLINLKELISTFNDSIVKNINIWIPFNNNPQMINEFSEYIEYNVRISTLVFYNAKNYQSSTILKSSPMVVFVENDLVESIIINPSNFQVNMNLYTESKHHNLYFNRKLYIDTEGNIKNGKSSKSYGNVNFDTIDAIVNSSEFQEIWFINKDSTLVCKDCEFRRICIDNRIPNKLTEGVYSYDTDCSYSPYNNSLTK